MNPVTIGESCKECGSKDFTYIERLGEKTCDECGLVLVVNPFEETTTAPLANVTLSNYVQE